MPGKILIVDDVSANRIVLKVKLAAARYESVQAARGAEAIEIALSAQPDLILLDVVLPDMDGIAVCRALKSDPATRDIPVVMVTATRDDDARVRALQAGAEEVFSKPFDDLVLLARIRTVLRAREATRELGLRDLTYRELGLAEAAGSYAPLARIALVTDRAGSEHGWQAMLAPHVTGRLSVLDAHAALGSWDGAPSPDVFVIPADIAGRGDGLRLMSELRSRPATRFAAVCIVLPPDARETAAMALDLGANDLIEAGAGMREIAHRIATQVQRKRQNDRLRASVEDGLRLAMTDPLTGLHNRRYALPHLARIAAHARQTQRLFAVMVLDLDRFKSVNDTFGHAAGDKVLVEIAGRFRSNLRGVDLVARMGGEEFLVALPDTSVETARIAAERLRRVVEECPVTLDGGDQVSVTLSIGLAIGGGPEAAASGTETIEALIARADHALLQAKARGRNTVTVCRSAA